MAAGSALPLTAWYETRPHAKERGEVQMYVMMRDHGQGRTSKAECGMEFATSDVGHFLIRLSGRKVAAQNEP